jgi:hypothetical protein
MGIRFSCPNGHKLNVKAFLAGKRGVCPQCGARFLIPMQTESPAAENPQSVAVGQSHSVDIVSPMRSQAASGVGSPSVIIAITDIDAPPQLERDSAATAIPTASIAAAQPPIVSEPIGASPEPAYVVRRERNRRKQLAISVVLLLLVIVLAVVLIWVLRRDAGPAPGGKIAVAGPGQLHQVLTMANGDSFMSTRATPGMTLP